MLPTLSKLPLFNSPDWVYEIKWDGYRLFSHVAFDKIVFPSKTNKLFSKDKFPSISRTLLKTGLNCVLDGEILVLNEMGKPDFDMISKHPKEGRALYMIFDLLQLDSVDLRSRPLVERKQILKSVLPKNPCIMFVDHFFDTGKELFEFTIANHLEGVIAKRAKSTYTAGITKDWLKFKNKIYCNSIGMNKRFLKSKKNTNLSK